MSCFGCLWFRGFGRSHKMRWRLDSLVEGQLGSFATAVSKISTVYSLGQR